MAKLTDQEVCDFINAIPISELSSQFVDSLPEDVQVALPEGGNGIEPRYVKPLAESLHAFIASVVASVLNAGSERDAVMENEDLADAIEEELAGWRWPIL